MKVLSNQNLTVILFLIPLSFILGIAVTEFLFFFCLISFLVISKNKYLFLDNKIFFLLLFSAFISISAYLKTSDGLKLGSVFYFRYILFSISIFYFSKLLDHIVHKKYFFFLIFSLLLLIFDTFYQFFNGVNIFGYEIVGNRVSSFFNDELIMGSYLVRLFPIIMWFIFCLKIDLKKNYFLFLIFFTLYFIAIYLSGERTSFFLWLVVVLVFFAIMKSLRKILTYSVILMSCFIFITSYFKLGSANTFNRLFIKTFNEIVKIDNNIEKSTSISNKPQKFHFYTQDHEGHILLALNLFKKNKIFGIGPQGFRSHCRKVNYNPEIGICSTHPHNILVQIITELGLIGLSFYIIAAVFVLFTFFKSIIMKKFNQDYLSFYSITIGLIINLFPLVPGGNFFNNWISIFIYFNIGLYLNSYNKCILKNN